MMVSCQTITRSLFQTGLIATVVMSTIPRAMAENPQVDYQPGIQLGKGFEILDDTVRGECVTFEIDSGESMGTSGQEKDYELEEITDNLQFAEMIDLSVAASYSAVFSKAEGKAEFVKEQKVNQYATTLVATSKVANPAKTIIKAKLSEEMADLANKSPADFRQKCGSYFVSAITTGGELYGFISIETKNVKEKEALTAMFNAKKGLFKVSAELDKAFEKEIEKRHTRIKVHEFGGTSLVISTPEELIAKYKGFPEAIGKGNARAYKAFLQSYRTLPNFPAISQIGETERALERIISFALQYMTLLEDVSYIMNHKEQFVMPVGAEQSLRTVRSEIERQLAASEAAAGECRKGNACTVPPLLNPDDLRERLPLRYRSVCPPKELSFPDKGLEIKAQKHVRGDGEMKGHNPKITLDVKLLAEGTRLKLAGKLEMKEDRKDFTTFTGEVTQVVFDLAGKEDWAHCAYDLDKIGPRNGRLEAHGGKDNHKWTDYNGTGLIRGAKCLSDTKGDDTGKLGCKEISLAPIYLVFRHEEDTLSQSQLKSLKADNTRRYHAIENAIRKLKGR